MNDEKAGTISFKEVATAEELAQAQQIRGQVLRPKRPHRLEYQVTH